MRTHRCLPILVVLAALLAIACSSDGEAGDLATVPAGGTVSSIDPSAPSPTGPASPTSTTPTPPATPQRNYAGEFGDYPFVLLVEDATADLVENAPPDPVLTFEEVGTPAEALERVDSLDAPGLVLDQATFEDFPIEDLVALYDAGVVVVAFEVPLDQLQLSLSAGRRIDDVPPAGFTIESPYCSVVHVTRPEVQAETGEAFVQRFIPELFHSSLARASDIASGRIRP